MANTNNKLSVGRGALVKSLAGHDRGGIFAVVSLEGDYVFLADGATRRVDSPKKKKLRHIRPLGTRINIEGLSDGELKSRIHRIIKENGGF